MKVMGAQESNRCLLQVRVLERYSFTKVENSASYSSSAKRTHTQQCPWQGRVLQQPSSGSPMGFLVLIRCTVLPYIGALVSSSCHLLSSPGVKQKPQDGQGFPEASIWFETLRIWKAAYREWDFPSFAGSVPGWGHADLPLVPMHAGTCRSC